MRKPRHDTLFWLSTLPSFIMVAGLVGITILVVATGAYESLARYGIQLFTRNTWNPEREEYGLLSPLIGSFTVSGLATLVSLFFSIPLAVFLSEILSGRLRDMLSSLVELMAGIPTVIYAIWGLYYVAPSIRDHLLTPLYSYFSFIPLFSCKPLTGLSILTASIVLGISLVPFTTAIIYESYRMIPQIYREACLGIGVTRYELVKIMLSMSKPAILASIILSFARASGETTITATLVGNAYTDSYCLLGPGYTIPALIANQYANANLYSYAESVLYAGALIILLVTLVLSLIGLRLLEKWRSRIIV